jgi:hypothetical protein
MNLKVFAQKIGYACIYSRTVDDACANLHRLITGKTCGYDEGVEAWREALSALMESDLQRLNWAGATFAEDEWRMILNKLRDQLQDQNT